MLSASIGEGVDSGEKSVGSEETGSMMSMMPSVGRIVLKNGLLVSNAE